jgi:glycine/D-amino acid oxidase-like deaminating enzyme
MGYIARLDKSDEFIQGSTYDHNFDTVKSTGEGVNYLRGRTKKTLPALAESDVLVKQWAGVRVNTTDRKPVLGLHPAIKNLHIFTGLGSKGLLYGKFLAGHYADHLSKELSIYPEISIRRFL